MNIEEATVAIWLGNFASRSEYEEYLEDKDENRTSPNTLLSMQLSQFAVDIDYRWFDDDQISAYYSAFGSILVADLIKYVSGNDITGGTFFPSDVVDASVRLGIENANAIILLYDENFGSVTQKTPEIPIQYIGTFTCTIKVTISWEEEEEDDD